MSRKCRSPCPSTRTGSPSTSRASDPSSAFLAVPPFLLLPRPARPPSILLSLNLALPGPYAHSFSLHTSFIHRPSLGHSRRPRGHLWPEMTCPSRCAPAGRQSSRQPCRLRSLPSTNSVPGTRTPDAPRATSSSTPPVEGVEPRDQCRIRPLALRPHDQDPLPTKDVS